MNRYCLSGEIRTGFFVLTACIILISMVACAKANKTSGTPSAGSATSQQSANSSSQNMPLAGSNVDSNTQPETAAPTAQSSPAVTAQTPPAPPAPVQQTAPPSQPAAISNAPSVSQSSTEELIKKEACLMALTKDDMGQGWMNVSVGPASILYTNSVCHVYFSMGGTFAPTVQNTVAVFRTFQAASDAYDKERPTYATVSNPAIGSECFLNNSAPLNRELAFRKGNVVVYLWLQQYQTGDIEHYARVVEQRITP